MKGFEYIMFFVLFFAFSFCFDFARLPNLTQEFYGIGLIIGFYSMCIIIELKR